MKNLRQDFRIFQDAKDNKTTIVCWGLSQKTKEKLFNLLLEDIQVEVTEISGVQNTPPDFSDAVKSTQNMTEIRPAAPMETPVLDPQIEQQLIQLAPASQIDLLCSYYVQNHDMAIANRIRMLMPEIYNSDENSMRQVIYAMRNMSTNAVNQFVERINGLDPKNAPDRDQQIQNALMSAPRETLNDLLHQIVDGKK